MSSWMANVYFYSALVGGTILVLQTILLVIGGDHGDHLGHSDGGSGEMHDAGGHGQGAHGGEQGEVGRGAYSFFQILSLKTLVAFVTFFGLTGLACGRGGLDETTGLILALCAGGAALYLVGYLMASLHRLQSTGNVDLQNAVGAQAQVHLRVPGSGAGAGKVLVSVQGRRLECKAMTAGPEIPTGETVAVTGIRGPDTLEVAVLKDALRNKESVVGKEGSSHG